MSTREQAYNLLETLTDRQLEGFIMLFSGGNSLQEQKKTESENKTSSLKGAFSKYADPALRALEEEAWSNAAAEKYKNS